MLCKCLWRFGDVHVYATLEPVFVIGDSDISIHNEKYAEYSGVRKGELLGCNVVLFWWNAIVLRLTLHQPTA